MFPIPLLGGVFLGWALGANDAANVFGTAVSSRIITFRQASFVCGISVILGAMLQGQAGIHTYRELADQNLDTVLVAIVSAALTVTAMTLFKLPISTSQAMVGAITGIGLATKSLNWLALQKVLVCWAATPFGAMLCSLAFYFSLGYLLKTVPMSMLTRDKILWLGLLATGIYGSYAIGANNVANATGIFSGQFTNLGITDRHLAALGGLSIALGVVTFSKGVMIAVGSGIMKLDAFTGLVAVASMAVTVHVFAMLGVPVSSSQAIVGAIIGIGAIRGVSAIRFRVVRNICVGWLLTPSVSLILSAAGWAVFCH
jgi:PiT family inorganic phosphate transporter